MLYILLYSKCEMYAREDARDALSKLPLSHGRRKVKLDPEQVKKQFSQNGSVCTLMISICFVSNPLLMLRYYE